MRGRVGGKEEDREKKGKGGGKDKRRRKGEREGKYKWRWNRRSEGGRIREEEVKRSRLRRKERGGRE